MTSEARLWWQSGVIYQVYPRSFQDSNGDGIGDLSGILSRLDYLVDLGIDAIWISPFYPSPMTDFGYDVSDYTGVDPIFGTLDDFDRLIAGIHSRGLKLILDFVPNHSSDEHPWFLESRSSRDNPKRDWYLWRDPAPGGNPPNNWLSHFGGAAWTLDPHTGQFYLHSFLSSQPDLNWRNPAVREAIYAAMRFWLDRGVDGFRMDVLWLLIKDEAFRPNPQNPTWTPGANSFGSLLPLYTSDRPETHAIVREMRSLLDTYTERVLIGEIYLPLAQLVTYYGADPNTTDLHGADMPFDFHLILTPWDAGQIAALISSYEALLPPGAWPNWVLGNHDQPRLATRVGQAQARVAAMLLLTLRGTPTLYNGDELALPNGIIPAGQVQDPAEKNQPGIGMGRDPERTPLPWDSSAQAGFTSGTPWLPLSPDAAQHSVAAQSASPRSVLSLYRQLLLLRRQFPALHAGSITEVHAADGVLSYQRTGGGQRLLVLLNLTGDTRTLDTPKGRILLTTILDGAGAEVGGSFILEAGEGVLLELTEP
ncbi:MAG: alpha-amylase family glycosyl hydrolase [Acidobacteriaceae bacterium]